MYLLPQIGMMMKNSQGHMQKNTSLTCAKCQGILVVLGSLPLPYALLPTPIRSAYVLLLLQLVIATI